MSVQHIHFVTGRLAEHSLRKTLESLAPSAQFEYTVDVLPITVAALMTPEWIAPRLHVPESATKVIVPGYCDHDLRPIQQACNLPVERGPRDLRQLPQFFNKTATNLADYGDYDIEIIAEINFAPRMSIDEILAAAQSLAQSGADVIDVGCEPSSAWAGVGDAVRALRDAGHRVSIDSLLPSEIAAAAKAGAELVLSVNSSNRQFAADWGIEVVAIPDDPKTLAGLDETVDHLAQAGVPLRIDPILEPIGFGFAQSMGRYLEIHRRYPDAEMMMGIGNLTELTDADSAAINVVLLGFCQELGIRSVLTTEVINWARSSVRECDLARRLVYHSIQQQVLPKHVEPRLTMLRDTEVLEDGDAQLDELAANIRDRNYRIFAEGSQLHALASGQHLADKDPYELFEKMLSASDKPIDASHAFYLGYEMSKAVTALTLGKQYRQDQALDWGFLTRQEISHRERKAARRDQQSRDKQEGADS
jgi:dihydropteroate synthase-like protein